MNPLDEWAARKLDQTASSLSRRALDSYQLREANRTIAWACARSPFYRNRLTEAAISSLDDLRRLPFTTAEDLRRDGPHFLCVSQGDVGRIVTLDSSGTTGPPKRTFFTTEDQQSIVTYFFHGLQLLARARDRVLILLPGARPGSAGDLLASAARRLGAVPLLGDLAAGVETLVRTINREEIHTVIGIPVHVLAIARDAAATGQAAGFPKTVLLCSDYIAGSAVQTLRRVWGCEVFGHYGTTEMGLGGGMECHRHCGYHLREADLLFEIVDGATGTPVAEGEFGEVVFMTLTRRGMPLIRYRTGDISRFLPGPCDCGSPLRRLDRVGMRKDGAVSLGGGQAITIGALDEAVFGIQGVANFTAEVTGKAKRTLAIEISFVGGVGETGSVGADVLAASEAVVRRLAPVEFALQSGALEVVVRPARTLGLPGFAKRAIRVDSAS